MYSWTTILEKFGKLYKLWLEVFDTLVYSLGEPTHTLVAYCMPKPLPPRNQCTGCFALTLISLDLLRLGNCTNVKITYGKGGSQHQVQKGTSWPWNNNHLPRTNKIICTWVGQTFILFGHYFNAFCRSDHICLSPCTMNGENQWSGRFLGIITGWDPCVCKSNWLHVDILRFSFTKFGYIL